MVSKPQWTHRLWMEIMVVFYCCFSLVSFYECNALSVKNVERNILCGGQRHENFIFVPCHK